MEKNKRMIRSFIFSIACVGLALMPSTAAAPAESGPSVLVRTTVLKKGSLPRLVTAYGSVQASSSARQAIMAPAAAEVGEVYVRQGEEVAKGASLIRLLPAPGTAASYAQAKSAAAVAAQLVGRTRKMVGQHLATAQQLAEAEKSESDARSALAALQAQGAGGPNILRAPFEAIVTGLSASPGALVTEGSALLELARPEGLVLKAGLIPAQAATVEPGNAANVTAIGADERLSSKVLLRGSIVDPSSGLVPVEIALPPGKFLPGEMAEASITVGEIEGYVVPHEAILVDDSGDTYVVQLVDAVAKKVAVRVLGAVGDEDAIDGKLDPKARLVLSGNHQLEDGMKVRIAAPDGKTGP
jgi:membrane fusion protein, multidrug efflux system